jgi:hypothetical protein
MHGQEDLLDDGLRLDERKQAQGLAALAALDVDGEGSAQQLGPRDVPGLAAWLWGTTRLRAAAWEDSTPKYLTVWRFGGGTRAARRAMRASGSRVTAEVPSDQGRLKSNLTPPSGRMCNRSLASGGRRM